MTQAPTRVRILIPTPLRSYTDGRDVVALELGNGGNAAIAGGPTLGAALAALDAKYPGLRFRVIDEQGQVRPHVRMFVDGVSVRELATPLSAGSAVMIVGALSGG